MQQGTLAEENAVPMSGQRTWPGPHHNVSGRGWLLGFMPHPETYRHVLGLEANQGTTRYRSDEASTAQLSKSQSGASVALLGV